MTISSDEKIVEEFEALTRDAGTVQRETLRRILEKNATAEYLQAHGLRGRTDPVSFISCIPVCTHSDIDPYIQRIADGDTAGVLTTKPITTMSLSSGTTQGKPKLLPFNDELLNSTIEVFRISHAFRNQEYPIDNGKALRFVYGSKQFHTRGGLFITTATTNVYRTEYYKNAMKDMQSPSCSPEEVMFAPDFNQALYCHLLCGLLYSDDVQLIFSTFAHSIVHAFRVFEQVWEDICLDIRLGVLSDRITVPSIRHAVSKILNPNPDLADAIHRKCSDLSNWSGLVPALWPNIKYVYGIMTGSMEPYLKKLRHYAGGVPLMSADYGSSEGWIAVNVNPRLRPESASFAVLPDIGYFEFIPLREPEKLDLENAASINYIELEPVGLTEVEVGRIYEVVVTNFAGLYRYRLGDIVKVVGFHNSTPELQFICRRSLVLHINIDKNTEKDLQLSVDGASALLTEERLEVVDFTSLVDTSSDPGHYVIFWELSSDATDEVLRSCCNKLDLGFVDAGYMSSRKTSGIGPLELRILCRGTFEKIMHRFLSLGGALSQYKTPRFVSSANKEILQILSSNVVRSYFSTAYGG